MFDGSDEFCAFVHDLVSLAHGAEADIPEGRLAAWVIKISHNGEQRRAQYKFLTQAIANAMGQRRSDNRLHREADDTTQLN